MSFLAEMAELESHGQTELVDRLSRLTAFTGQKGITRTQIITHSTTYIFVTRQRIESSLVIAMAKDDCDSLVLRVKFKLGHSHKRLSQL